MRVLVTDFVSAAVELEDRVEETVAVPVAVCVELRVPVTDRVCPADLEDVLEPDAEVDGLRVPVVVRVEVTVEEGERVPVEVRETVVERVLVREAVTVVVVERV